MITFDQLFQILPKEIKDKLLENKSLRENPLYHPEENAFEHIKIVVDRLSMTHDIDLVLSGLFHDICKKESAVPRENSPYFLCRDHEKKGADFSLSHIDFILSLGGNPQKIHYICWNHMRMKVIHEMKKKKRKELEDHKFYKSLLTFSFADKMGFDWNEYMKTHSPSRFKIFFLESKRRFKILINKIKY